MLEIFDEFDLELEKIDMDIVLFGADGGNSIDICGGGGDGSCSNGMDTSNAPTCFNVCG